LARRNAGDFAFGGRISTAGRVSLLPNQSPAAPHLWLGRSLALPIVLFHRSAGFHNKQLIDMAKEMEIEIAMFLLLKRRK
jgi:hypothetical protein